MRNVLRHCQATVLGLCIGIALVPSGTAAQPAAGGTPVTIGVLTDLSSSYSDIGGKGSILAAKMAIDDFGGTVLGKPIQLVSGDHQNKPDLGVSIAREWFDKQGVDMIVDLPSSAVALAVQNVAREKNRISIISSGSTDIATNQQCSPTGVQWTYDSYSAGKGLATALAKPGSTWFFVTVDYVGGLSLENSAKPFIEAAGGKILGSARHPLNSADMSSYLLQAQSSGAQFIAFANSGSDLVNGMKQAGEFGLSSRGQQMVGIVVFTTDLKAIGLKAADGLVFVSGFSTQARPEAAAWARRFLEQHKAMPNDVQAGVYSGTLHYLKAVQAAGTNDAMAVMAKMREMPVNDMFATNGVLRKDGRMVHDMYLLRAKKPSESTGPWDLTTLVQTIPGDQAFRPLSESACPLVKN